MTQGQYTIQYGKTRRQTVFNTIHGLTEVLDWAPMSAHDRRAIEEAIEILKGVR